MCAILGSSPSTSVSLVACLSLNALQGHAVILFLSSFSRSICTYPCVQFQILTEIVIFIIQVCTLLPVRCSECLHWVRRPACCSRVFQASDISIKAVISHMFLHSLLYPSWTCNIFYEIKLDWSLVFGKVGQPLRNLRIMVLSVFEARIAIRDIYCRLV